MSFRGELEALFGSPHEVHLGTLPPGLPPDLERLELLELVAQLWDQVWWLSLPWWKRAIYRARGFRDPIERFYTLRR